MRLRTKSGSPSALNRPGRLYQRFAGAADQIPWLHPSPRPYDVSITDQPPLVWYRVPKVGSRTILRHLRTHTRLELDHPYQIRIPKGAYRDYLHFAFVRNPWDRLVSCWLQKVVDLDHFQLGPDRERLQAFPAFVDYVAGLQADTCNPHFRSQAALFDLDRVDFVGRFERFSDDLATVCRRVGLPAEFEHRNPTDHDHYSVYYDDRTAEIIGRFYERDIRLFGYEFGTPGSA